MSFRFEVGAKVSDLGNLKFPIQGEGVKFPILGAAEVSDSGFKVSDRRKTLKFPIQGLEFLSQGLSFRLWAWVSDLVSDRCRSRIGGGGGANNFSGDLNGPKPGGAPKKKVRSKSGGPNAGLWYWQTTAK